MNAATEGRDKAGYALRAATGWLALGIAYLALLALYRTELQDKLARDGLAAARTIHAELARLDPRDPDTPVKVSSLLDTVPLIRRARMLTPDGAAVFDSASPANPHNPDLPDLSYSRGVKVHTRGTRVEVLVPADQVSVLYSLDDHGVRVRLAVALAIGLLLAALVVRAALTPQAADAWHRFWRLRIKFMAAILLLDGITAGIIFFSVTGLQTREQTRRIEKQAAIFAQFSTDRVISSFVHFFPSSYADRFIPDLKEILASNEDLLNIRIVNARTRHVLFDSEQAFGSPGSYQPTDLDRVEYPREVEEELKTRDLASQSIGQAGGPGAGRAGEERGGRVFEVVNTFRTPTQSPVFLVEYFFSYGTLYKSLAAIREQVLLDLIPSVLVGFLIAMVFAQLLISPVRKLVAALRKVSGGDFEARVAVTGHDEIGMLGEAFNAMTDELKRKKELRKYLSDSNYKRIVGAGRAVPGAGEGAAPAKIGGVRAPATILFSDIRDFVAHCENLEAEEITSFLSEYFTEMVDVVHKNGGEVDKFIGDAILAVFYAEEPHRVMRPLEDPDAGSSGASVLQAISCGLDMRARLGEFNARRRAHGKKPIEIGVGISHGEVISGPIGSQDRMDFTVIGDVVNLANRIEKLSKLGKHTRIVFSNHVEEKIRGLMEYEELPTDGIRGKTEDVRVYELVAIKGLGALRANLAAKTPALRIRSVELLGQSGNPEASSLLLAVLDDADEDVRIGAIGSLARLVAAIGPGEVSSRIEDRLFARIADEPSQKALGALVNAIGRVCRTERVLELATYLDSESERIVANTIEAIGQARSPRGTDLILPKLTSRNNRIKANAAMAIFASGHLEVIDVLKPMLMHSEALMRSSAAFAIGELTAIADTSTLIEGFRKDASRTKLFLAELQECVPMLVALLKDPEPMVRRQSVIALGKIKDKSAVLPMIEMIDLTPGRARSKAEQELTHDILEAVRTIGSHKLVREVLDKLSL